MFQFSLRQVLQVGAIAACACALIAAALKWQDPLLAWFSIVMGLLAMGGIVGAIVTPTSRALGAFVGFYTMLTLSLWSLFILFVVSFLTLGFP